MDIHMESLTIFLMLLFIDHYCKKFVKKKLIYLIREERIMEKRNEEWMGWCFSLPLSYKRFMI
jgi:hypothetical protein